MKEKTTEKDILTQQQEAVDDMFTIIFIGLFFLGWYGTLYVKGIFTKNTTQIAQSSLVIKNPEVEFITNETGENALQVTFFGESGDIIYLSNMEKYYTINAQGNAIATISFKDIIPSNYKQETYIVDWKPYYISQKTKERTLIPMEDFSIQVPTNN